MNLLDTSLVQAISARYILTAISCEFVHLTSEEIGLYAVVPLFLCIYMTSAFVSLRLSSLLTGYCMWQTFDAFETSDVDTLKFNRNCEWWASQSILFPQMKQTGMKFGVNVHDRPTWPTIICNLRPKLTSLLQVIHPLAWSSLTTFYFAGWILFIGTATQ